MIHPSVRSICIVLAMSSLCFAQTANRTKLYPRNVKPQKNTATLTSSERRIGDVRYQIFYLRNAQKHEAFRVRVGFYEKGQL